MKSSSSSAITVCPTCGTKVSGKIAKKVYQNILSAKPINARTAYSYYMNEIVTILKLDEGINHRQAMSKAGINWNEMTDDEKKNYNDQHDADKNRYEKQLAEWKAKGYYLLEDGMKSSELVPRFKKKEKAESKPDKNNKRVKWRKKYINIEEREEKQLSALQEKPSR